MEFNYQQPGQQAGLLTLPTPTTPGLTPTQYGNLMLHPSGYYIDNGNAYEPITNKTGGLTPYTSKVKNAMNLKGLGIGLIGHKKPEAIMFLTRFGIHTFGLKFPIDVVILDRDNKVVKIRKSLKQNSIFVWPIKYNKVLELPKGLIQKYKIKTGCKIKINLD